MNSNLNTGRAIAVNRAGFAGIALGTNARKLYTASVKPTLTGTAREAGKVFRAPKKTLGDLELTGDNRASAAEMLGLSRQSLYSKLRRFGLGHLDSDADSGNYR